MSKNLFCFLIFVVLSIAFISRYSLVGQAVYGDGIYYWAYTRSIVMDKNLDLRDEGDHFFSPESNNNPYFKDTITYKNDLKHNKYYPIGASIMWIPFFAFAHYLSSLFNFAGLLLPTNGYADIYQIITGLGSISFLVIGIRFLMETFKFLKIKTNIIFSITALIFATNLFYYSSIDVLNTHTSSFLISSIILYVWLKEKYSKKYKKFILLGVLIGILGCIRTQDLIFASGFIAFEIFNKNYSSKFKRAKNIFMIISGIFIGFFPQILTSEILFGSFFTLPYTIKGLDFNFLQPKIFEIILFKDRGLLYYSPIILLSVFGVFLNLKKNLGLSIITLLIFTATYAVISVYSGWTQGESFGMRMFISTYPLLIIGLNTVANYSSKYFSKSITFLFVLIFIIQNFLMIIGFIFFVHQPTYIGSEISKSGKIKAEILDNLKKYIFN